MSGDRQFANFPTIEYGHCGTCGETVFMAVRRGRIARWRHNRNRWQPIFHRPVPVMCGPDCADPAENPWPTEPHWWGPNRVDSPAPTPERNEHG